MTRITRRGLGLAAVASSIPGVLHAQAPAGAPGAMKMASATINDVQHEWLRRFQAGLRDRVGDRVPTEIYPASQLGAIPRMVEGLLLGTIESFITPTSFVVPVDPRMQVFDAPGLFRSPEHLQRVITDPEVRRRALGLLESRNVKGIGISYNSPVVVLSRRPIRTLADFRGQKIRTFASPLQVRPMEHLGATPVPMALSEVLPALQSGALDGMLAGMPVLTSLRFYDVAKAVTEIHPAIVVSVFLVNKRWHDRQPAEVQRAMAEVGEAVDRDIYAWTVNAVEESNRAWTAGGGEIIRLAPDEQDRMMRELRGLGEGILAASAPVKAEYDALLRATERLG